MTSAHVLGHFLRTLSGSAVATFLALFPIVDPFGGIPVFFTMTASLTRRDRYRTALKTGVWVFVIRVGFWTRAIIAPTIVTIKVFIIIKYW